MTGSNRGAPPGPGPAPDPADLAAVRAGALGFSVRTTPRRRTVLVSGEDGAPWFAKIRRERGSAARREQELLRELAERGFRTPVPLGLRCEAGHSVLAMASAPGRPLDALLREALMTGGDAAERAIAFACGVVAPMVRRLHDHGLCFRDLYWNHLFAESLEPQRGEPWLIDVERTFRPRFRRRRWRIKDLAGLLSSLPAPVRKSRLLAFLRASLGGLGGDWKALARAVAAKADRIRAHRPRYG